MEGERVGGGSGKGVEGGREREEKGRREKANEI